jgi:RNA polymerase sigma-70 factor (sigma-E family)
VVVGTWPLGRQDFDEEFRLFAAGQWRGLYRAALLLCGDPGIAEDLAQTALMRTHARWPRLREGDAAGYARQVITNANIDRWRRDRGRESLSDEVPDRATTDVAVQAVERDAVMRALSDLSVVERRVVVLRFLDDATESETARQLGMPLGTVKSVTRRSIGKLRASEHLSDTTEVNP